MWPIPKGEGSGGAETYGAVGSHITSGIAYPMQGRSQGGAQGAFVPPFFQGYYVIVFIYYFLQYKYQYRVA